MPRTKSDIANSAIRIFLQDVGKFYDEERGLDPFRPKRGQKQELLEAFGHQCCYCGEPIDENSLSHTRLKIGRGVTRGGVRLPPSGTRALPAAAGKGFRDGCPRR